MAGGSLTIVRPAPAAQPKRRPRVLLPQDRGKTEGRPMKRNAILALLLGATLVLNACATVKGAGKDIESVGQAGEDVIND